VNRAEVFAEHRKGESPMDTSYIIKGVDRLDTPALVFYEEKIPQNVARMEDLPLGNGIGAASWA
jgi:hypothetical protein